MFWKASGELLEGRGEGRVMEELALTGTKEELED
jgi:hypothetical protein